jgi:hypothetical protein
MANNLNYNDPVLGNVSIATDDISGTHWEYVKLALGADDTATIVTASAGLPVAQVGVWTVTGAGGSFPVTDAGSSLTVDAPVATPVFVRLSDGSAAITTLPVSLTSVPSHPVTAAGDVAHGAANSGNPIQNGCEAIAHGANPTAVTAGQRTKAYANRAGIPFTIGGHPNIVTSRTQFTAAQTDASLVGTIATGTKVVVTGFQVTLDNASTVYPSVRIGFGATNTPTGTGVIGAHGGVPAGGGFGRGDGSGIIGIGGDGEELRCTTVGTATGNGVEIVITYYLIES